MIRMLIYLVLIWTYTSTSTVVINAVEEPEGIIGQDTEDEFTLKCHKKSYTYMVYQTDENGKQCWDKISVNACWGRCDSNEISDWRFPYKKSNHPVCVHFGRTKMLVTLRYCEEGAKEGTNQYEYLDASDCRCQVCSSSDTSCEGLRYRPIRSKTFSLGFV